MGILVKPIVTEKLTIQGDKLNRYGFIVDRTANKIEIK
ncbi:MAG: 50S ribosomal protein L23, partial [Bacteroidales bacterium]|nr:50S ribosomal protein L23 [Bacteroidales bacterium]